MNPITSIIERALPKLPPAGRRSFLLVFAVHALLTTLAWAQVPPDPNALPVYDISAGDMVTILAPDRSKERYGERFAKDVYEAAFETTDEPAGKGLVIIGEIEDPHPIMLTKKYLDFGHELSIELGGFDEDSKLDNALEAWNEAEAQVKEQVGVGLESLVYFIPMPLEGPVLNLYLIARELEFDEKRIDERYASLSPANLRGGAFETYDWVIYLPPKNALYKVIREVAPKAMKAQNIGFFKRALVRGALFTVKPALKDAMEAVRKSMLYDGILRATSELSEADRKALTNAYREALMPKGNLFGGRAKKRARAFEAIGRQKDQNAEYRADPFRIPEVIAQGDPSVYPEIVGTYEWVGGPPAIVFAEEGKLYYRRGAEGEPKRLLAGGGFLFVTEDRKMTIEFNANDSGSITEAKLKKKRWRKTLRKVGSETGESGGEETGESRDDETVS